MLLAPPIVSHASIFLTRFWSIIIFFTENASERVTDKGNPYGMATTTTIIPSIKKFKILSKSVPVSHSLVIAFYIVNLISKTIMMTIAEYNPNLPISPAKIYSFYWSGVGWASSFSNKALILPIQDWSPTTKTTILPSPESTFVPLIMIGEGI